MDEFDNDNLFNENESDDELSMQQSIQSKALPLPERDAPMSEQDIYESQNNVMAENEVPSILEQQPLDIEMDENVPHAIEPVNKPMVVNDDKENENPIELLKAPMPPPPVPAL